MAKRKRTKEEPVAQVQVPERDRFTIRGRIIDIKDGFTFIPQVSAVRIRCESYSLLVMEDYLPTMGRIDGDVTFLTPEGEQPFHNILGFFKLQHNEFTLLVEGNKPTKEVPAQGGKS